MEELKKIFRDEIDTFRETGHKFLNKELSVAEFKGISGGMGVYAQRGGQKFMIRLRIPSGVYSQKEMELTLDFAKKYNLDKIHLTTREAVQLHDMDFDDVCDTMIVALENDLFTRGGGGNFPRNVTLSPLAGVKIGEAFDPTPYALLVNDYFVQRMNTYKLPRKLKVAFSNDEKDTANASVTDLGFLAQEKDGRKFFKLFIAGGIGRCPAIGVEYDEEVALDDVLYYVEAMVRLFINEGDYENKHQARTRFIVERLGKEEFLKCFKKYLAEVKNDCKFETVKSNPYEVNISAENTDNSELEESNNVVKQKQNGLYTVIVKPVAGQLPTEYFEKIVNFCKDKKNVQARLSMEESLYIRNLNKAEAEELLALTDGVRGKTRLQMSLSCVGIPTCQIGIEKSQQLLRDILDYFDEKGMTKDILPSVQISGCGNSCSRHQVAMIGFGGTKKRVDGELKDAFELHLNGKKTVGESRLGKNYGVILVDKIPELLYKFAEIVDNSGIECFRKCFEEKTQEFEQVINEYLV